MTSQTRETMEYDVVIVGGGVAGLSAAIRLKQQAARMGDDITVCVLEKGAHIGAHILSGAMLDPAALSALIPDWRTRGAPLDTPLVREKMYFLTRKRAFAIPERWMPPLMRNAGAYLISLGQLARWLGEQAEALGVEIFPGFAGAELAFGERGEIAGVITGEFGRARDGCEKPEYTPGMQLNGKYVFLAEGARGHLGEQAIAHFGLARDRQTQTYGIGFKERWQLPIDAHSPGLAIHAMGWPLSGQAGGGIFLYHWGRQYCSVGMVVHLNYANPHLSPYEEFQRAKTHPLIRAHLTGGKRLGYGARAITEGGWQSLPRQAFPGGVLLGETAGMMNVPRIKGIHNAMWSGIRAADAAALALHGGRSGDTLHELDDTLKESPIGTDLYRVRNVKPLWSRFGTILGVPLGGIDMWWQTLGGPSPFGTLAHGAPDWARLKPAARSTPIVYPPPDGTLRFDRTSSLHLSNTHHEEDQPPHLHLTDETLPLRATLPRYNEPAQRYCPAGVYEIVTAEGEMRFQINAANCLHCKTCTIKDPAQNIAWLPPEGGGGPNYVDM